MRGREAEAGQRGVVPVPEGRRVRVVVMSDAANEADDAYAVAHALLTPSFDVRGLVAGHFGTPGSVDASRAVLGRVRELARRRDVPLVSGVAGPLRSLSREDVAASAAATRLLARETAHPDSRPLFVLCMGALTDLALALRERPEAAGRMTVVWVGGGRYPAGGHEANLARDIDAAREVFRSDVALWQIPSGAYKTLAVPLSQLRMGASLGGRLGRYLYGQLMDFREHNLEKRAWINPESWVLGDQAAVGVLLAEQKGCFRETPAPGIADDCRYLRPPNPGRVVRVYNRVNDRLVIDDLFCKLALFGMGENDS